MLLWKVILNRETHLYVLSEDWTNAQKTAVVAMHDFVCKQPNFLQQCPIVFPQWSYMTLLCMTLTTSLLCFYPHQQRHHTTNAYDAEHIRRWSPSIYALAWYKVYGATECRERWKYHSVTIHNNLREKQNAAQRQRNDPIHKSQNASVPYHTMLHSEQKCAHFCSEWSNVGYGTGAFWDLWNCSIAQCSSIIVSCCGLVPYMYL